MDSRLELLRITFGQELGSNLAAEKVLATALDFFAATEIERS